MKKNDDVTEEEARQFSADELMSSSEKWLSKHVGFMTFVNVTLFASTLAMLWLSSQQWSAAQRMSNNALAPSSVVEHSSVSPSLRESATLKTASGDLTGEAFPPCEDPEWCNIPMPSVSYFKFDPPTDLRRWQLAQRQAASGEQVLLREVIKVFPSHFDFLDGDISFRKLHYAMDMFVDERRDLTPLTPAGRRSAKSGSDFNEERRRRLETQSPLYSLDNSSTPSSSSSQSWPFPDWFAGPEEDDSETAFGNDSSAALSSHRRLEEQRITSPKEVNGKLLYPWEQEGRRVIPDPYDFRAADRAPVIGVGYTAYTRDSQTYFSGNRVGGAFIDRKVFFKQWRQVKDRLEVPLIAVCSLNENWGMLSTKFPNRTAGWGRCCDSPADRVLFDFLDHEKTLMLVTNQHTNITHPKLLILPRGIPLTWGTTRILVWDAQRNVLKNNKKNKLLFAAASKWGPRPQILACISSKFAGQDFDGHVKNPPQQRLNRDEYYVKLATARFGVGLPGLGYDTFRAWELMTMGSIVVLEKNVGFDRSMWRLPALFVEDFAEITPELLRVAYVEALYRAKDFEFQRLTMNYWFSVIANVSSSKSVQPMLDAFPFEAEDQTFTRPREPYPCGVTNTCGKGTKRTPKVSC